MYENAESEIARIVALAALCPEDLKAKAFEILLQGYVDSLTPSRAAMPVTSLPPPDPAAGRRDPDAQAMPPEVAPRLRAMAKRRGVTAEQIASLFDFSSDPFSYAPVNVEGTGATDRERKVALLVAARSFLATGRWVADWAEIKAMCTHQNCYDAANFAATLTKQKGQLFRAVTVGTSVELSAAGTEQAEVLLASLAGAADATSK
jgi:hypothetical protein